MAEYMHHFHTVGSLAFFRERGAAMIEDSVGFIRDMEAQDVDDFALDIAVDRPDSERRLRELFSYYAPNLFDKKQLSFTKLWRYTDEPQLIDNKAAAETRVGIYMHDKGAQVKTLLMLDPDRYPADYIRKMRQGLRDSAAPIVIANQRPFQKGTNHLNQNANIQSARLEVGHRFDFPQILNHNIAGFCNIAFNLASDLIERHDWKILKQASNKQLDRFLVGKVLARGGWAKLLDIDMYYEQSENNLYGANKTGLDIELDMQLQFVRAMDGLTDITLENKQVLAQRMANDEQLELLRRDNPKAFNAYRAISKAMMADIPNPFWGEAVQTIEAVKKAAISSQNDTELGLRLAELP